MTCFENGVCHLEAVLVVVSSPGKGAKKERRKNPNLGKRKNVLKQQQ